MWQMWHGVLQSSGIGNYLNTDCKSSSRMVWRQMVRRVDSVDNAAENSSIFSLIRLHWLPVPPAKTLHQQSPPVLNWGCRLMQVDLYNGRKIVVVVKQ